MDVALTKF